MSNSLPGNRSKTAVLARCTVPGCIRNTSLTAGNGLAEFYCRYHTQFKGRHGSPWQATYQAKDLAPYVASASKWIISNSDKLSRHAVHAVESQLLKAGPVDPAMNLRHQPAAYKANVAFARLREANVKPERIVAIYLAVHALIEDDWKSHRTREFRIVQAAKAVHRLASGTHRKWDVWDAKTGDTRPLELHVYPRSSGHVLRKIGEALEEACGQLAVEAMADIIADRTARFGEHPSHLPPPGWNERNGGG